VSSRRRHTRFSRDWSSDVCSSDLVLDMGATIGADAQQLVDYAILGSALARCLFGHDAPTVGLLNVGTEEVKGLESIREAGRILRSEERRVGSGCSAAGSWRRAG